ncbi:MAG: isochorismatase family protein [Chitinivibrionales bacterium]|nr:isochorismatase family protein [Chitinivibrionales bacterium]MBD3356406.1 isochorismatase family protein [Chitinivibrionales bacterium]
MIHPDCLSPRGAGLVVIDIQERFAGVIAEFGTVAANAVRLIRGFRVFATPIMVTEQYPKGLGRTVEPVRAGLGAIQAIEKMTISCTLEEAFMRRLSEQALETVVVCGIETHVCVNQTVLGLLNQGIKVHVPADAVGSRKAFDHQIALRKMERAGAIITTTEMCLFELAERAGTAEFKEIQRLVKEPPAGENRE